MQKPPAAATKVRLPAGAQYHEELAAGWTTGYASGGFRKRLACFRTILDRNVEAGQAWLDLGCGSGVLTKELLSRGAVVVAVDGSPGMLEQARAHVGSGYQAETTWIQSDVQSLPGLPDHGFDGVLCSSVIEYVDSPEALLREVVRVMRPGGKFIVSVPPRLSTVRMIQKLVRKAARSIGKEPFRYLAVSRFETEPNGLDRWLGEAGFVLDRVTRFDPVLPEALQGFLRPALMIVESHQSRAA